MGRCKPKGITRKNRCGFCRNIPMKDEPVVLTEHGRRHPSCIEHEQYNRMMDKKEKRDEHRRRVRAPVDRVMQLQGRVIAAIEDAKERKAVKQ